jgi:DNA polymerase III subunit gamma/tau
VTLYTTKDKREGYELGQALYRKYRSKKLSEIVGQKHITDTLERAIKTGKLSHAYLFTGPRGVGKTSIARILAHEVNGLPYTDESIHLDIIEIDAASNRRIDEIRDLRDKVHIAPTSAKYKVYIIDEVHMLTKEAFNALLKTLEEPPAHVIFILATTEAYKLPETIISRTQRFTFKAIEQAEAVEHLRELAKSEGMQVDDEALELLAEHGGGSFRDAIGLLDQVGNSKKTIVKADVEAMIGIAPKEAVDALLDSIFTGQPSDIIKNLETFIEKGIAPAQTAKQLSARLRAQLIENKSIDVRSVTDLLKSLLGVASSSDPAASLELALFSVQLNNRHDVLLPVPEVTPLVPPVATRITKPQKSIIVTANEIKVVEEIIQEPITTTKEPLEDAENIQSWWPELVNVMKKHNNTIYGVLRMAHPELRGDCLRLGFAFGLHTKKIADAQTSLQIQNAVKTLIGRDVSIEAYQDKNLKGIEPNTQGVIRGDDTPVQPIEAVLLQTETADLGSITSIFGGGEVLES